MRTKLTLVVAFLVFQFSFANLNNRTVVTDPTAPSLSPLTYCDPNNDGFGTFDLTTQNTAILAAQSGTAVNYAITYHETLTQANTGSSPLASPYYNISPNIQTVYYRIRNVNTSDYAVGSFQLVVNPKPYATFPPDLSKCDSNNDGIEVFDFSSQVPIVLGAINPATATVTFYTSQASANASVAPILNIYNFTGTNGEIIWVRVESNSTGCYDLVSFNLGVAPRPIASGPQNYSNCDSYGDPNDGVDIIDLTTYDPSILNGQDPATNQIKYFATQADALSETNQISLASAQSYNTSSTTIWVKVINSSGCFSLTTIHINITASPNPIINIIGNRNTICVDYPTDIVINPLTLDSGIFNPSAYTFIWYENGGVIGGANNSTYTVNTAAAGGASRNYSVKVISDNALGCQTTSLPFSVIQSGQAVIPSGTNGYTITNLSGVQSITVAITGYGYGSYEYSLDNGPRQTSNVFQNVSYGIHTINVWDTVGDCDPLIIGEVFIEESAIPAPTGLISQTFPAGSILANIVVNGTNVQWYASANNKNQLSTFSTPLPLNTLLIDGTTYYATQTVGGIESTAYLPVTVNLTLGMDDSEILPIQFTPNPIKDNLTMQSAVLIKSVSVYTMLGQKVFEQNYNNTNISIDLSRLTSGNYILKAQGETGQKTLRIIKE